MISREGQFCTKTLKVSWLSIRKPSFVVVVSIQRISSSCTPTNQQENHHEDRSLRSHRHGRH
ncbi:hypothetical protein D3791_05645 [Glutamicibacter mishrai]|uniref:Uncharacterized protein n=1 Tax=Glutamicibacter mishrai TaxID=1775880 RepID=A0A6H0SQP0_9MICC|nr:hypothetical protein D3791_05645 [Glutamicibacter mishrai]